MNMKLFFVAALLAAIIAGIAIGRYWNTGEHRSATTAPAAERDIAYWVAPMDPAYRRDAPGKSPMGMDLVPVYADDLDSQPDVVKIDPTVANNLGVRTAAVEFGPLSRRIETVGYVGYDEEGLTHFHTRVDGWIEDLTVTTTGDRVEAGQVLFELYSPTLVNAQEEFLVALRSNNTTLSRASRERLKALGMKKSEIDSLARDRRVQQRVPFYADRDGVIAYLGVREGIYVTPATNVITVADLERVWVLAEVFERQAAWVAAGQAADIRLDYLPGRSWRGQVDYVYPELDPATRTLKVRLRLDNADTALKPNMFARVIIEGAASADVPHVPRDAVIRGGTGDRVVVELGGGRYRSQPVVTGIESGDRIALLDGLSPGDRVVVSAQFLIDSESNIDTALGRIDSPEAIDHSGHEMPMEHDGMNHSQHNMPMEDNGMDHSQHEMPMEDNGMDHSQHEMPMEHDGMDHSGHDMPTDKPESDHSGHDTEAMT